MLELTEKSFPRVNCGRDSVAEKGQRELFLSKVNNRETKAAIEANNDTYCLQKRIEKFRLNEF